MSLPIPPSFNCHTQRPHEFNNDGASHHILCLYLVLIACVFCYFVNHPQSKQVSKNPSLASPQWVTFCSKRIGISIGSNITSHHFGAHFSSPTHQSTNQTDPALTTEGYEQWNRFLDLNDGTACLYPSTTKLESSNNNLDDDNNDKPISTHKHFSISRGHIAMSLLSYYKCIVIGQAPCTLCWRNF